MDKIAVTTTSFGKYDDQPLRLLRDKGMEILLNPYGRKISGKEILDICRDAVGIIAGTEKLDEETMGKLKKLRAISRCGVGLDNVDLSAAEKLGIKVFNTPDAPTDAVAELTIALVLGVLRKVNIMDSNMRHGIWEKAMGNLLKGKKIGIVGFGRIGRKVAGLLKVFDCAIGYTDPFLKEEVTGFQRMTLEKLLSWADIISVHTSTDKEIIGHKEIGLMKNNSWILNISRGGVVNEDALYEGLISHKLAGAALDVFKKEPYGGPLKELTNVILTPHIGSYAIEARVEMEMQAVKNLIEGLDIKRGKK